MVNNPCFQSQRALRKDMQIYYYISYKPNFGK